MPVAAEENKALIRRFFAAIDAACPTGDADVLDEFLAPDFVEHNPFPGMAPTREGWKQVFLGHASPRHPGSSALLVMMASGRRGPGRTPPTRCGPSPAVTGSAEEPTWALPLLR